MANRAYLISTDANHPDAVESGYQWYFDSRHHLPISWLLMFDEQSFSRIHRSSWVEGYFVREKEVCRADWNSRLHFLENMLNDPALFGVPGCMDQLFEYPGKHLLMDYHELDQMGGMFESEVAKIYSSIRDGDVVKARELIGPYVDFRCESKMGPEVDVYGCWYR